MRIDWSPQLQAPTARRDARGVSTDRSFANSVSEEPQAAPAASAPATSAVEGLFVLQEVADELSGRRRAAARGAALLDRLDELRLALLSGRLPRAQLHHLRALAREHGPAADDPKLAAILAEIELRVAVELAKLEAVA